MNKKSLLGVVLAGLAMFVWGFVYWAGIGSMVRPMKSLPVEKEDAVMAALTATETKTNVYFIPGMPLSYSGAENDAWFEKHRAGPLAGLIFINEGKDPMGVGMMISGLVHMLITAGVLAFCLTLASARLTSYSRRLGFVALLGLLSALWVDGGEIIWMFHPVGNAIFNAFYHFSGVALAGVVLAAFIDEPFGRPALDPPGVA